VHAIDIGPAVRLHKRLAMGAFWAGAAIYLEALVAFVLLDENAISPVALVPIAAILVAQFVFARKPARLLLHHEMATHSQSTNRLARACRMRLLFSAAFVVLLWLGGTNAEGRTLAPLLGIVVVAPIAWPVVRLMREADAVDPMLRRVRDRAVLLDCLSFDIRRALALRLQSVGGQRKRWAVPLVTAGVALVATLLVSALAIEALGIGNGPVGLLSAMVAAAVYYRGVRKAKLPAAELRASDPRPPVLLLRQFRDDMLSTVRFGFGDRPTFEHALAASLSRIGPTISVGRPGERLQPLGAAREYLTDPDWQRAVEKLIDEAAVVVFVVGDSENLLWEFRAALTAREAAGILVVMPPLRDAAALHHRWERFTGAVSGLIGKLQLPARRVLAMTFVGREPVLIVCDERPSLQPIVNRTEPDYRFALRLFMHLQAAGLDSVDALEQWIQRHIAITPLTRSRQRTA
jgi:hypothetical protein